MKTIQVNKFIGNISIPKNMRVIRYGETRKGDRISRDGEKFLRVAVGGLPVSRYMAVLRRIKNKRK